jgi:hypothetical protein
MESELDKLKAYGNILETYAKNASDIYEKGTQRKEDLPLAINALKDDFYKLFPKAKEK